VALVTLTGVLAMLSGAAGPVPAPQANHVAAIAEAP
jgi:hypothetical protein